MHGYLALLLRDFAVARDLACRLGETGHGMFHSLVALLSAFMRVAPYVAEFRHRLMSGIRRHFGRGTFNCHSTHGLPDQLFDFVI